MTLPNSATLSTYGGPFVDAYPLSNPNTDQDAGNANQCFADTAGMTHTTTTAWARFTTETTTGTLLLNSWGAVWGEVASNAVPTLTRSSAGVFSVNFPTTITDSLGNTVAVNFQRCGGFVEGSALLFTTYAFTANTIAVFLWGTSFTNIDSAGTVLHVWAQ